MMEKNGMMDEGKKMEKGKVFAISVREILSRTYLVTAGSLSQAVDKVQEAYDAEKIVLGADDFLEYDIAASPFATPNGTATASQLETCTWLAEDDEK